MILKLLKLIFGSFKWFKSEAKNFKKLSEEAKMSALRKYNEEN